MRAESRSIISRFREGQPTFAPRIASFMLCDRSLLTGDFLSKPFRVMRGFKFVESSKNADLASCRLRKNGGMLEREAESEQSASSSHAINAPSSLFGTRSTDPIVPVSTAAPDFANAGS